MCRLFSPLTMFSLGESIHSCIFSYHCYIDDTQILSTFCILWHITQWLKLNIWSLPLILLQLCLISHQVLSTSFIFSYFLPLFPPVIAYHLVSRLPHSIKLFSLWLPNYYFSRNQEYSFKTTNLLMLQFCKVLKRHSMNSYI